VTRPIVQRSDSLYLVGDRSEAILVDVDEGTIGGILPAQSLCAHLVVAEPWRVIRNRHHLPALVIEALERFRAPGPTL
jgi:hypothetical protein